MNQGRDPSGFMPEYSKCSSSLFNSQTSESHDDSWRVHLTVNDTKVNIPGGGEIVVPHKTELYPSVTVQPAKGDELCALAIKGNQPKKGYFL